MEEFMIDLMNSCLKGDIDDLSFEMMIKTIGEKSVAPLLIFKYLMHMLWKSINYLSRDQTEIEMVKSFLEASRNNTSYHDELWKRVLSSA